MENKTIFCRELAVVDEIEENLGNRIATLHGESAVEVSVVPDWSRSGYKMYRNLFATCLLALSTTSARECQLLRCHTRGWQARPVLAL